MSLQAIYGDWRLYNAVIGRATPIGRLRAASAKRHSVLRSRVDQRVSRADNSIETIASGLMLPTAMTSGQITPSTSRRVGSGLRVPDRSSGCVSESTSGVAHQRPPPVISS